MCQFLRWLFFALVVHPLVLVAIGVNVVCNRKYLPRRGPAIIVANHNSHLDTLVIMTLLPMQMLTRIQPVAAEDYFLKNRILAWFAVNIIGILPIVRKFVPGKPDPLMPACKALTGGRVLIIYPEGSRGEPEHMTHFKKGIAHLARRYPQVPVVPVFLHGLGRILPRGKYLPVPFFCDVFVGKPLYGEKNIDVFMWKLKSSFEALSHQQQFPAWD
jgi:1-acyl-sn-glycerol-3-phosphate acyltransferase